MISFFRFIPILLFISLVSPLYAASFDCQKATTETEKAICLDDELSALDDIMAEVYKSAPDHLDYLPEDVIKGSQIVWLNSRNSCGGEEECIFRSYNERLREISKSYNSFIFEESFTTYGLMGQSKNGKCTSNSELTDWAGDNCITWILGSSSLRGTSINNILAFRFDFLGTNWHTCNLAGKAVSENNSWIYRNRLCELKFKMGSNGLNMETNGECRSYCGLRAKGSLDTKFYLH